MFILTFNMFRLTFNMFRLTFNMSGKALTLRKSTNKFGNSFTKLYLCMLK